MKGCLKFVVYGFLGLIALVVVIGLTSRRPAGPTPAGGGPSAAPATTAAPSAPSWAPKTGDAAVLGYAGGGGSVVWLATSDESYDQMIAAQNAATRDMLVRLIDSGRVAVLPTGTPVVVMKRAVLSALVEVTGGDFAGVSGWIQVEQIRPPSEYAATKSPEPDAPKAASPPKPAAKADAATLLRMGRNLEQRKNPKAAREYFERVIREHPDTPEAKEAKASLDK